MDDVFTDSLEFLPPLHREVVQYTLGIPNRTRGHCRTKPLYRTALWENHTWVARIVTYPDVEDSYRLLWITHSHANEETTNIIIRRFRIDKETGRRSKFAGACRGGHYDLAEQILADIPVSKIPEFVTDGVNWLCLEGRLGYLQKLVGRFGQRVLACNSEFFFTDRPLEIAISGEWRICNREATFTQMGVSSVSEATRVPLARWLLDNTEIDDRTALRFLRSACKFNHKLMFETLCPVCVPKISDLVDWGFLCVVALRGNCPEGISLAFTHGVDWRLTLRYAGKFVTSSYVTVIDAIVKTFGPKIIPECVEFSRAEGYREALDYIDSVCSAGAPG